MQKNVPESRKNYWYQVLPHQFFLNWISWDRTSRKNQPTKTFVVQNLVTLSLKKLKSSVSDPDSDGSGFFRWPGFGSVRFCFSISLSLLNWQTKGIYCKWCYLIRLWRNLTKKDSVESAKYNIKNYPEPDKRTRIWNTDLNGQCHEKIGDEQNHNYGLHMSLKYV